VPRVVILPCVFSVSERKKREDVHADSETRASIPQVQPPTSKADRDVVPTGAQRPRDLLFWLCADRDVVPTGAQRPRDLLFWLSCAGATYSHFAEVILISAALE
jgi:hypothetical protein